MISALFWQPETPEQLIESWLIGSHVPVQPSVAAHRSVVLRAVE